MVSIPSNFYEKTGNFVNRYIQKPGMKRFLEKGLKDPAGFAAKMLVYSLVSKDAVNCIIYTGQSATNKEIPDDKRSFVMFNDLINGILNVGGQLASFALVEKLFTPKQFGKRYSGTLKDNLTKEVGPLDCSIEKAKLHGDNLKDLVKAVTGTASINSKTNKLAEKIKNQNPDLVEELKKIAPENIGAMEKTISEKLIKRLGTGSSKFGSIEKGFALLVSALATTALIKRTLVPLISTPIAGKLSDKAAAKKEAKKVKQQTPEERLLDLKTTPWAYTGKIPDNKTFKAIS